MHQIKYCSLLHPIFGKSIFLVRKKLSIFSKTKANSAPWHPKNWFNGSKQHFLSKKNFALRSFIGPEFARYRDLNRQIGQNYRRKESLGKKLCFSLKNYNWFFDSKVGSNFNKAMRCYPERAKRDQRARQQLVHVITCCSAICFLRSSSARSCSDVLSIMLFPPTSNLLSIIF